MMHAHVVVQWHAARVQHKSSACKQPNKGRFIRKLVQCNANTDVTVSVVVRAPFHESSTEAKLATKTYFTDDEKLRPEDDICRLSDTITLPGNYAPPCDIGCNLGMLRLASDDSGPIANIRQLLVSVTSYNDVTFGQGSRTTTSGIRITPNLILTDPIHVDNLNSVPNNPIYIDASTLKYPTYGNTNQQVSKIASYTLPDRDRNRGWNLCLCRLANTAEAEIDNELVALGSWKDYANTEDTQPPTYNMGTSQIGRDNCNFYYVKQDGPVQAELSTGSTEFSTGWQMHIGHFRGVIYNTTSGPNNVPISDTYSLMRGSPVFAAAFPGGTLTLIGIITDEDTIGNCLTCTVAASLFNTSDKQSVLGPLIDLLRS